MLNRTMFAIEDCSANTLRQMPNALGDDLKLPLAEFDILPGQGATSGPSTGGREPSHTDESSLLAV